MSIKKFYAKTTTDTFDSLSKYENVKKSSFDSLIYGILGLNLN